jgi:hypothetical protein
MARTEAEQKRIDERGSAQDQLNTMKCWDKDGKLVYSGKTNPDTTEDDGETIAIATGELYVDPKDTKGKVGA